MPRRIGGVFGGWQTIQLDTEQVRVGTSTATASPSTRIYRGWWNVAAVFVSSVLVIGSSIYSFGLYVVPVGDTFGLSRATTNTGIMILLAAVSLWSPFVGSWLDRFSPRWVIASGGVLFGTGLCIIANANSISWICFSLAVPLALGVCCAGPLAAATVAARWFRERRGRALGIVATSTATGGFIMTQVGARLMLQYDWRIALTITGIAAGSIITSLALLLVRPSPSDDELRAGGEIRAGAESGSAGEDGLWSTSQLLRSRNFWLIGLGAGLILASDGAILISKIPYLLDIGIELQAATFLVACQSASAMAGKIGIGFASEHIDLRKLFVMLALAHIIMIVGLIMKPGYAALLILFLSVGVAIGGIHPIFTNLIARAFGARSYGAVSGRMNLLQQPIQLLAIYFAGVAYDASGDYDVAFGVFGVLVFVACLMIGAVRLETRPKNPPSTIEGAAWEGR